MSNRETYIRDEKFTMDYEIINDHLFIHVVFDEFNKNIFSRLKEAWVEFLLDAYFDGYEEIFTYTKDPRIVDMIGGAEDITTKKVSDQGIRMYKWDLS